ncbi:MAG: hypothetical protein ACKPB7_09440, partial [Sphaerospermopsis kisseleviana]
PEDSFTTFYVLDLDIVKNTFNSDDDCLSLTHGVTQVDIKQSDLDDDRWQISPYSHIFQKIDKSGIKLRNIDWVRYTEGITTGRDSIFEGEFKQRFPDEYYLQRVAISDINSYGCE